MFSITKFKSSTKFVRSNQFFVEIFGVPNTVVGYNNINSTLSMRCESVEFPGRSIATTDDVSFGPTTKFAYDMTYTDITLGIMSSEDMSERKLFEEWMNAIVTPSRTSGGGHIKYYENYASSGKVVIYQINENNDQLAKCTCYGAFPISIGPVGLSYEEFDAYQRFAVTISYRYHEIDYNRVRLSR